MKMLEVIRKRFPRRLLPPLGYNLAVSAILIFTGTYVEHILGPICKIYSVRNMTVDEMGPVISGSGFTNSTGGKCYQNPLSALACTYSYQKNAKLQATVVANKLASSLMHHDAS